MENQPVSSKTQKSAQRKVLSCNDVFVKLLKKYTTLTSLKSNNNSSSESWFMALQFHPFHNHHLVFIIRERYWINSTKIYLNVFHRINGYLIICPKIGSYLTIWFSRLIGYSSRKDSYTTKCTFYILLKITYMAK